ncbi:hypothetical protein AOC36_03530 [Erysipelothrix larvae]|uniref:ABC transporter permease n=1 Tax=Erysipelothrix larvae TaxID=1514105 RepID=A0A0X8GZ61_9FIRM|nr:hypothetical protein [Erysipelothrix larvae]AMC93080.1 hypothetical protein AOC36_03530 [Erysipelothrix larvae]
MLTNNLHQSLKLLRFYLKKDRNSILIWLLGFIISVSGIAFYYSSMEMSEVEKQILYETLNSPAMILLLGLAPDVQPTTGMLFSLEMSLFTGILVVIMNILIMSSNTRKAEEGGVLELIRALPTGRFAPLIASLIQALIVNLILSLCIGISFIFIDTTVFSTQGGFLFAFSLGGTGFLFACFSAIWSQIFQSNRSAMVASFAFLGFNFILRGITDIQAPHLSWLFPLSWLYLAQPFTNNRWFILILMYSTALIAATIALLLNYHRDYDGAYIRQKPGREYAKKSLLGRFGLLHSMNKTTLISWVVGVIALGFTFGYTFTDIQEFFKGNDLIQVMFPNTTGADFSKQYLGMLATIFSILIAIAPLTFMGRLLTEEKNGRLENLISKPISRLYILMTHLIYALGALILLSSVSILSTYGTSGGSMALGEVSEAILILTPAILFILGFGILLCGILPKLYVLVWIMLGYGFFVVYFGNMLKMPEWLKGFSPFYHITPLETLDLFPLITLTSLGILFTIIGFVAYQKRDLSL